MHFARHNEIVGGPAFWRACQFSDDAACDLPPAPISARRRLPVSAPVASATTPRSPRPMSFGPLHGSCAPLLIVRHLCLSPRGPKFRLIAISAFGVGALGIVDWLIVRMQMGTSVKGGDCSCDQWTHDR
jgi:hypothetical protein